MCVCVGVAQAFNELRAYDASTGEKGLYLPTEWKNGYDSSTKEYNGGGVYYSLSRKRESKNFVVFWDKAYGDTAPDALSKSNFYYVDIDYMLQEAERFYELYSKTLGFVNPEASTTMSKYKCVICLIHTQDWMAYGGGYDFVIPALWINPATCKPIGHTVAHEIGHSFHYMCFSEANNHQNSNTVNTGFHLNVGNGQGIWEQTAQWQAAQAYPAEMFNQSMGVFRHSTNYAFTHEWHRYQSYWFHYYLCQYYNDMTTVGQVWNQPQTGSTDFNQALMDLKGLSAPQLYALYYDYASRVATWDLDATKSYRNNYIGQFDYYCCQTGEKTYQVAYASVPQSTGFNVIPLQVPAAGTDVTIHFTALKSGCDLAAADPGMYLNGDTQFVPVGKSKYNTNGSPSARGFRLGYVALMKDGTRQYFNEDKVYGTGSMEKTEDVSFTVPANVDRMWFIVSPALTKYYQHKWDENILTGDDQWPYRFQLDGTDIGAAATVYVASELDGRDIADITFTYDVYLPVRSDYETVTVTVDKAAAAQLGTAFQMNASDIPAKMVSYAASGPSNGKIMFYAANADGSLQAKGKNTNATYGHWFSKSGAVVEWGSGNAILYSDFTPGTLSFAIGQYPGKVKNGDNYTIRQALRYKKSSTETATAYFVFNVHVNQSKSGAELSGVDYQNPSVIDAILTMDEGRLSVRQTGVVYDLSGHQVTNRVCSSLKPGIYVVNGKKILVK